MATEVRAEPGPSPAPPPGGAARRRPAAEEVAWVGLWLAVLLLFVLAQVFREGTRLRDDLEGTV